MKRLLLLTVLIFPVGCDWMPGKPDPSKRWQPAEKNLAFTDLYSQNCRGCHGIEGTIAGSISMDQPIYVSFIPEAELRTVIANGVPGSNMPAFARANGGPLTDEQIDVLVTGILSTKPKPAPALPPYSAPLGDPAAGAQTFAVSCASCHGPDGRGLPGKAGSVVEAAYLGMVSDQYLRTIVVAGRPELGCPDFHKRLPDRFLTNEEVADLTAWLTSHRANEFGKPIPLPPR